MGIASACKCVDVGYEDGEHKGLGVLAGSCVRLTWTPRTLKSATWGGTRMSEKASPICAPLPCRVRPFTSCTATSFATRLLDIRSTHRLRRPFGSQHLARQHRRTQFHAGKKPEGGLQILQNLRDGETMLKTPTFGRLCLILLLAYGVR